mgnify:CR=1 FL=1
MNNNCEPEPLVLETLVRRLSGTQLKIVLTMGLLPQPVVTRRISLKCQISRSTTLVALEHLAQQGLVIRHEIDDRQRRGNSSRHARQPARGQPSRDTARGG